MKRRVVARNALVVTLLFILSLVPSGTGPLPVFSELDIAWELQAGADATWHDPEPIESDPARIALQEAVTAAFVQGEERVALHLAVEPQHAATIVRSLFEMGATVETDMLEAGYVTAQVPPEHALHASVLPGVLAASIGGSVQLPDPAELAAQLLPPGDTVHGTTNRASVAADEAAAEDAGLAADAELAQTGPRAFQPQRGLLPSLEALGLPTGDTSGTMPDGRGVTIAVIDTGADPGQEALLRGTDGKTKIIDYVDFSGEGEVPIVEAAVPTSSGMLTTSAGVYQVPRGLSKSGRFRFGLWREDSLPPGSLLKDLNRNGRLGDEIGVLLIDTQTPGVYDTVIVDTNGDKDFTDERQMKVYRQRQDTNWLGPRGGSSPALRLNFVVTDIHPDGAKVTFGFDGHGHGTQVAAVAAGNPADRDMRGVAPGASLMILKAIDSSGQGDWDNIAKAMIYAAQNGADVISLSLATSDGRRGGLAAETQLMMSLARIHDVLFVEAAGNNGPGLASAASPGDGTDVVTVGAWLSEAMWRDYYGYPVGRPGIAVYSATGPRLDGSLSPTLVAPGTAYAPAPHWLGTGGRQLIEGTSIATPQVAGGAALIMQAMRNAGVNPHYRLVKQTLEQATRPLPGYQAVEQGLGTLRIDWALNLIGNGSAVPIADVTLKDAREGSRGLLANGVPPGQQRFTVADLSGLGLNLTWRTSAEWLRPDLPQMAVPPQGSRTVTVDYDLPPEPGLYSGIMIGEDERFAGTEARALTTVIQPYEFTPENNHQVVFQAGVLAAQYERTFLRVPEGIDALNLSIRVPRDNHNRPLGRLRLYVIGPDHHTLIAPQTVGVDDQGGSDAFFYQVISPIAGVWEVIAYSLPDLAQHGLQVSFFEFEASLSGVLFPQGSLHLAPPDDVDEVETTVTVQSLDRQFVGRLIGAGFGSQPADAGGERLVLYEGQAALRRLPTIGPDALWLRVSLSNPTVAGTALNVTLYRIDPVTNRAIQVQARHFRSVENPVIELNSPPPGEYAVMLEATGLSGQGVEYQYRTEVIADTGDLQARDPGRMRMAGETWTVPVTLRLPKEPGRYYGRFMVYDDENQRMIGTLPVVLDRSKPRLQVRVLPLYAGVASAASGVEPVGTSQAMTLEVRDAASGRLVDVPLSIDGRLYHTHEGKVVLPLRDGIASLPDTLHVTIEVPTHAWYDQRVPVPRPLAAPDPAREQEFGRIRERIADQYREAYGQ